MGKVEYAFFPSEFVRSISDVTGQIMLIINLLQLWQG